MAQHIRKNDLVMVLRGKDRGRVARVLRVLPKKRQVVVEGVNLVRKHVRRSQKNPQGGVIEKEMPMDWSKVLPVVDGKPTRVRFVRTEQGAKVRVAVRSGQVIGPELKRASSET